VSRGLICHDLAGVTLLLYTSAGLFDSGASFLHVHKSPIAGQHKQLKIGNTKTTFSILLFKYIFFKNVGYGTTKKNVFETYRNY
jgi:hypothetical protein